MNKTFAYLLATVIYLYLNPFSLIGQGNSLGQIENKVDKIAQKAIKNKDFPALSIGIYKEGKSYKKHFGILDKKAKNPPTDETLYEIASVTKTFTGCLLAMAVVDKKLRLTEDIRDYLPGRLENLSYQGSPIQIQHLVTHTGGLPFILPKEIELLYDNPDSQLPFNISKIERKYEKAMFFEDLKSVVLTGAPGSSYNYSDVGAEILAYILEQVYQSPYEKILEEHVFREASMTHSVVSLDEQKKAQLAPGYNGRGTRMPYSESNLWAAGAGIKSTLPDLIHFIEFQLNEEISFVSESHKLLYQDEQNSIGYFWNIGQSNSANTYLYHHGGAFGAQNWLLIYPDLDMGISIITNQSTPETAGKLAKFADSIFQVVK